MKKQKSEQPKPGAPEWMNTYGDMVTLLLTFFVLLYSFSNVDANKWERLASALSGGSGVLQQDAAIKQLIDTNEQASQSDQATLVNDLENFENLYRNIKEYVKENDLNGTIIMTKTDNEIRMRLTNNVLFDSGKATLRSEAYSILDELSDGFKTYEVSIQMIRIEGHTDNLPISTNEFPSNWELSTARAVRVLKYLIEVKNIPPNIVSAVGYGEYHPYADNNTEEGRMKNRRVDLVIARANQ